MLYRKLNEAWQFAAYIALIAHEKMKWKIMKQICQILICWCWCWILPMADIKRDLTACNWFVKLIRCCSRSTFGVCVDFVGGQYSERGRFLWHLCVEMSTVKCLQQLVSYNIWRNVECSMNRDDFVKSGRPGGAAWRGIPRKSAPISSSLDWNMKEISKISFSHVHVHVQVPWVSIWWKQ
jgi:hypothetical protein